MANFNLTGSVVGFGSTSGNLPTIELFYQVNIGNWNRSRGFFQSGVVQTSGNDTFRVSISVPDETIPFFASRSILMIRVYAFAPSDNRRDAVVTLVLEGTGQDIYDQMVNAAQNLTVQIDLSGCTFLSMTVSINGTARELNGIEALSMNLLSGPGVAFHKASTTARRDGSNFRGRFICRTSDLESAPTWILLYNGDAFPASGFPLRQIDAGRVFVRTRSLSGTQAFTDAGEAITISQIDSRTGVGTISERLPEVISEGLLFIRDLDLDFINGNIRVRGRIGFGGFGIQLFGFGRFQVTFAVNVIDRSLLPCSQLEFDDPLGVAIAAHTYDISPDTDLDELDIAESVLEDFISGIVAETVRTEIRGAIRDALNEQIDNIFNNVTEALSGIAEDPESLAEEIRDTLCLHIDTVSIDADNLNIRAFASIWHWAAALQTLDCAANAVSVMFFSQRLLPMFRRYERALSGKSLAPWMKHYRKHSKELAKIVLRDPSLGGQIVRLAFDLQPILNEKGKVPLSSNAVERLLHVVEITSKQASPELVEILDQAVKVFTAGEGYHFEELVKLAANIFPSMPQSEDELK